MSVSDEKVVIDANHLYAGEDLTLTANFLEPPNGRPLQEATFAGGCSGAAAYQREPGVVRTEVGYAQGADPSPSTTVLGVTDTPAVCALRVSRVTSGSATCCSIGWRELATLQVGNDQGRSTGADPMMPKRRRGRDRRENNPIWPTHVTEVDKPAGTTPSAHHRHLRRAAGLKRWVSSGVGARLLF